MKPTYLSHALLALMASLLVSSSLHKPFSYDEIDNLGYGLRFLTQGPAAPMNGQRMPVLALNALPCVVAGWTVDVLHRSEWRRMVVRAPTMVFALLLAWLAGRWAGELYGATAGLLALGACVLHPNVLAHGRPARWHRPALVVLAAWHVVSTLSYHPHYMSYFNELIGRRIDAWRYLADSNLDWEDRRWFIRRFQAQHPEIPLVLEPDRPVAGYVVVGANQLVGVFGPARYRWLRENFEPIDHIGYSHLVFHVTPARLREVMDAAKAATPAVPPP